MPTGQYDVVQVQRWIKAEAAERGVKLSAAKVRSLAPRWIDSHRSVQAEMARDGVGYAHRLHSDPTSDMAIGILLGLLADPETGRRVSRIAA